jgi:LMBR1 domain-containing protein 1
LDNAFGLFGTIAYGVFAFYLLLCVIKGNFKFGLRVPFLFEIHPMKYVVCIETRGCIGDSMATL